MTQSKKIISPLLSACILLSLCAGLIQSQQATYGQPPGCLTSRTDVVPCTYRNPKQTTIPKENEFGVYSTRIKSGAAGPPKCFIRSRKHRVSAIDTLGGDDRVKFIYSPGIRLEPKENYANQLIVTYNVTCPPGHLAFFNLTSIDLEGKTCHDPASNSMQCRDYIRIVRPGFGNTESCGSEASADNMNQLELGVLNVTFRTSDSRRRSGFEATVICFRREDGNLEGCTRPDDNSTESMDVQPTDSGRRKRDLDDFNNMWKKRLDHINRMKRQTGPVGLTNFRFEEINVTHGVNVIYDNKALTFFNAESGMEERESIKDILVLHTFDANGTIDEFRGDAKMGDTNIPLPGPGPLKILGQYAYFQLFVIDPRGILPNPAEMAALNNLTQAQFALVTEDNSTRLDESVLNPDCTDLSEILGFQVTLSSECAKERQKRQSETNKQQSSLLDDSAILAAIMNENACNPVLKTSALATIAFVEKDDPPRLEALRESLKP